MSDSPIKLYMAPATCARVPSIALEHASQEFETVLVRFASREHKSPEYKRLNPKGKVPALVIDGEVLTENVAIINYLNGRFPKAHLMPAASDPMTHARQIADLCFCSATLHPIVTRIRMSHLIASEDMAELVWNKGCASMAEFFTLIEQRFAEQPWWYGEQWSAMDAYLYWVFWCVEDAGFDVTPFPTFQNHARTMEDRPAVQRALAREREAQAILEAEGLSFKPPPRPWRITSRA